MKKLIFLFLIALVSLSGQDKYITAGDSISTRPNDLANARKLYFYVTDSSDTIVDTLVCETRMSGSTTWFAIAVIKNTALTVVVGDIIPGDNAGGVYEVNMEYPSIVRVRRTNVTSRAQSTSIWWTGGP